MNRISELTRRRLYRLFCNSKITKADGTIVGFSYLGNSTAVDFWSNFYDLHSIAATDHRLTDFQADIARHVDWNGDWEPEFLLKCGEFDLMHIPDEKLLEIVCYVFEPFICEEDVDYKPIIKKLNGLLHLDGYDIYVSSRIAGKPCYSWREYHGRKLDTFFPFSLRNRLDLDKEKDVLDKSVLYAFSQLIDKYDKTLFIVDTNGNSSYVNLIPAVGADLRRFYPLHYISSTGDYEPSSTFSQFIGSNYYYCIFDALECFARYLEDTDFEQAVTDTFIVFGLPWAMMDGKIEPAGIDIENFSELSINADIELKNMMFESERLYNRGEYRLATEKIWQAYERVKTLYIPYKDKKRQVKKLAEKLGFGIPALRDIVYDDIDTLHNIGNDFMIRHTEVNKISVPNDKVYEYFYCRCRSLVSFVIKECEGKGV